MTLRVIAIDWSGAQRGAAQLIWLAEIQDGNVLRLEAGRDRAAIAQHLIEEVGRDPELVVGFDFAFSLPAWFLEQHGLNDAPSLWELVEQEGESWLADCSSPFWGRPGVGCPDLPAHFRKTDRDVPAVSGIRPKSVFQIGGAGAVGTGSLRGMPLLRRLRNSGFAVWPFDPPRFPLAVEIYPRALTGAVHKSSAEERRRYLDLNHPGLDAAVLKSASYSEDAFDALVSGLVMDRHAAEFKSLSQAADTDLLEGRIWLPPQASTHPPKRRPRGSSRTRVGPVFNALVDLSPQHPNWVGRLLDLAVRDVARRPWAHQNLSPVEGRWSAKELGLRPPVSLLSWLVRNLDPGKSPTGTGEVPEKRRGLAARDPAIIEEALGLLRSAGAGPGWHVLEGPTYPDVVLITPDALVVIEGKYTERSHTTDTTWMDGRHQMLRHLDAAWELRGRRAVYGLFIVDSGEGSSTDPPPVWEEAAKATTSENVLRRSLPHRSQEETSAIASSFVGVTTWQAVCDEFQIDRSVLAYLI